MVNEIKALTDKFENETHLKKRIQLALQISAYYRTHSKENLALEYMQTALEEAGQNDYKIGEGRTYKELSLLHYSKLALDKALEYSFQALTIFKTYGKNLDISEILCNIGVFYNAVNLDEKGKTYFLQSLKYNPNNIPPLINLGEYYVRHGETVTAIEYFKKTIAISQAQNKMGDLAYAYKSMGEAYNSLQRYDTAIDYFNKSLETLKGIDDEHTTAFAWLGMGISFMNKERIDLSLEYSFRALKLAKKLDNSELYWFSYNNLSMIYEKSEDYKNAFKYLNLGMKLQTKLYSRKLRRRIAELEAVYEIEKKDLETKRLLEKSARLASIGVMTAGITHEINQPLNSIVINSEGLLFKDNRDKVLPDLYRESIEKIFKSAQRIDQIIKHIRTYWNASDDLIKSTAVNVNDSINDALGFLNQQIQSHGIDLQTFFSFDNPVILG
ncbi:MAG: tetratricopeptide repeat protein, partial [Fidelibacterota bacterium]